MKDEIQAEGRIDQEDYFTSFTLCRVVLQHFQHGGIVYVSLPSSIQPHYLRQPSLLEE